MVGRPTAHFLTPSLHWLLTKREPGFPGASSQDHRESCCLLKGSPHTRPEFVLRVWDGGVSLPSPFMFPGLGRACFAHMRSVPWPRRKKKVGSLRLAKAAAGFGAVEEVRVSAGARGEVREMLEEARRSSCPGAQTRWLPKQSEGGGGEGGRTWVKIGLQCWGGAPRRLAHAQPQHLDSPDKWLSKRSNVRLVRLESLCVAWPTSSFRRIKRSLARTLRAARVQAPETTQSLVFRLHDGELGRPGEAQFPVMQPEHQ